MFNIQGILERIDLYLVHRLSDRLLHLFISVCIVFILCALVDVLCISFVFRILIIFDPCVVLGPGAGASSRRKQRLRIELCFSTASRPRRVGPAPSQPSQPSQPPC